MKADKNWILNSCIFVRQEILMNNVAKKGYSKLLENRIVS